MLLTDLGQRIRDVRQGAAMMMMMIRTRCLALVIGCALTWSTPGLAQPPGAEPARTSWGDPDLQAHWNNNTIVPLDRPGNRAERETLTDKVSARGQTVFGIGENLRLVERFTRVADDTIDYWFTVEVPTTLGDRWTAAIPMSKIQGLIFEYAACHEGNHSMPNMLRGARAAEP